MSGRYVDAESATGRWRVALAAPPRAARCSATQRGTMLQLFLSAALVAASARFAGKRGARRYNDLTDDHARGVHELFASRVLDWMILVIIAVAAVDAVLAGLFGSWIGVAMSLGAVALSLLARALRQAARPNVNAGFDERDIEPLQRRETSARRERRQKQFAIVTFSGFMTFRVLAVVGERTEETWLAAPAVLAGVIAGIGALALVWSMAWRFGDERPA